MIELWTPDSLTPLHPDDQGAACEQCGDPAAWYGTADGAALCTRCADGTIAALAQLAQRLRESEGTGL